MHYCWSTWADILGEHYGWHKRLGVGGADNATIARRILSTARKDDTVVIMWTGYDRWSSYNNGWQHNGCLVGNKDFYTNYYNPVERFTTTMDYAQMVDNHSKIKGYTCYHFSAFPWLLSEMHTEILPELVDIYEDYSIDNWYVSETSLLEFQEKNNEVFVTSNKYDQKDTHPTPITHWKYLNQVIANKIKIDINQNIEQHIIQEQQDVIAGNIN